MRAALQLEPGDYPDGTAGRGPGIPEAKAFARAEQFRLGARWTRDLRKLAERDGRLTWRHVLEEQVAAALAEHEPEKLRAELVQVAAVCGAWTEALERRAPATPSILGLVARTSR